MSPTGLDELVRATTAEALFRAINGLEETFPEFLRHAVEDAVRSWLDDNMDAVIDAICRTSKPFDDQ